MFNRLTKIFLMTLILCLTFSVSVSAASIQEQREQIDKLSADALERVYQKHSSARRVIKNSYAYATISSSGVKVLLLGSDHGRGIAVNNRTGEKVYMQMKEVSAGLGIGANEYDLVFVLQDKQAWNKFISGSLKFGANAVASAKDGVNGGSIEGADIASEGIWVYQITKKGLSLEVNLKGTKIYPNKKLNKKDVK